MSRPELEEELAYLARSIEDLALEREAGDLSDREFARLSARYGARRAEVERELEALAAPGTEPGRPGPAGRPRRRFAPHSRRARLITGWGAFSCFLVAAILLSMTLAGVGPFVAQPSLSVGQRVQIMLAEASELGSTGKVGLALDTYAKVLALRPHQPEALADGGWLSRLAGLQRHDASLVANGDAEIEAAVRLEPGYAAGRAYDAMMLYLDRGEAKAAAGQFNAMLVDHPSRALVWSVHKEAVAAYRAAHQPVPPSFAGAKRP